MTKIALIDVCDVAAKLSEAAIREAKLTIDFSKVKTWDLFEIISDDEKDRVHKLFNNPEFWRSLEPTEHIHAGLEALKQGGFKIKWVTSPWYSCESWESVRRAWLFEQFKTNPLDITITADKYLVDGDMLIDDRPKHVESWKKKRLRNKNKHAILFDTNFNQFFDWPDRRTWTKFGLAKVLKFKS
jgi:5'(3')-deoxyribonucleotidase